MPPAGYMWPGGPPLPEWVQEGVRIVSTPEYVKRTGVRRKSAIVRVTEAYVHYMDGHSGTGMNGARPEHFLADWQEDKQEMLPRLWPAQRPSIVDIAKRYRRPHERD